MATTQTSYPVRYDIKYPNKVDRLSSFFRLLWVLPVLLICCLLTSSSSGAAAGLFPATALMIVFRQKYPRWWFNFALELSRFSTRVYAYMFLLTDRYPSTTEKQAVQFDIDYPDVQQDLNRWLPLVKWFLAIPHLVVLMFLIVGVVFATIAAWFAILFTGKYPQGLFDYVVGVGRWGARVNAYAFLLTTDQYPPFSLS